MMSTYTKIITVILLFFIAYEGVAQFYPVQATFYSKPPYPIKLSDYANPLGQNLNLKVVLRDLNLGPTQVYLKFSLKSNQLSVSNPQRPVNLPIFTLTPGVVRTFTQADFSRNFEWLNLGISPIVYASPLQEGIYNFSVEVIDVLTNKSLSGVVALAPIWVVVNDPPLLTLPANQGAVKILNPQNLLFQWVPRHRQANAVEYEFVLTELLVPGNFTGNLQNLFLSQPPYYKTITKSTSLLFGPSMPPLIPGRTYGFRVRAIAKMGFEDVGIFRNDGYSEIFIFQYGEKNRAPTILSAVWGVDGKALITWQGVDIHTSFEVRYNRFLTSVFVPNTPVSTVFPVLGTGMQKLGNSTYSVKMPIDFTQAHEIVVGGITETSTDQRLYSPKVLLGALDWSRVAVNGITRDGNDYLLMLAGKSRQKSPNPLVATCQMPTVNPTEQSRNAIAIGDTIRAGGTDVIVMSDTYAQVVLRTAGGGSSPIRLFFSSDFQINKYNEVIAGYLTSEMTNHRISLFNGEAGTETGGIYDKQLIVNGVKTDSLKTLANQIYDQSKQNLAAGISSVGGIKNQLPRLTTLLTAKLNSLKLSLGLVQTKLTTETDAKKKESLQKLKSTLEQQIAADTQNVANLNTFRNYYFGYDNTVLFRLLPRFFV